MHMHRAWRIVFYWREREVTATGGRFDPSPAGKTGVVAHREGAPQVVDAHAPLTPAAFQSDRTELHPRAFSHHGGFLQAAAASPSTEAEVRKPQPRTLEVLRLSENARRYSSDFFRIGDKS